MVSLEDELKKLTDLSKDCSEEILSEQIRRIAGEGVEIAYQIIQFLVKEKMDRGYSKEYTLAELQERLPWKKSRLIERLQSLMDAGVLIHVKRKYKLRKENELVWRIWNYYNYTGFQKKEKSQEIWELILKKKQLENKYIEKLKVVKKTRFRELKRGEEEAYRKEIIDEIKAFYNPLESTSEFLEKNIVRTMGYKRNK